MIIAIFTGTGVLLLCLGLLVAWWAIDRSSTAAHAAPPRHHRPIPAKPTVSLRADTAAYMDALTEARDQAAMLAAPTPEHSPDWTPRPDLPAYATEIIGHGGDTNALIDSLYTKAMAAHITAVTQ